MPIDANINKIITLLSQISHCNQFVTSRQLNSQVKKGIKNEAKAICNEAKQEIDGIKQEIDTW